MGAMSLAADVKTEAGVATLSEKKTEKKPSTIKSQTDHSFEDLLIQGQYHFSDEAVTTVEEDKVLDALIGVRTDFKDRLEKSSEQF